LEFGMLHMCRLGFYSCVAVRYRPSQKSLPVIFVPLTYRLGSEGMVRQAFYVECVKTALQGGALDRRDRPGPRVEGPEQRLALSILLSGKERTRDRSLRPGTSCGCRPSLLAIWYRMGQRPTSLSSLKRPTSSQFTRRATRCATTRTRRCT